MIQRKQSLLLLASAAMGIALLFVPSYTILFNGQSLKLTLEPIRTEGLVSTAGHTAAIFINFGTLALASIAVFLYNQRSLQLKISYLCAVLWLVTSGMIAFCPFVSAKEGGFTLRANYLVYAIAVLGIAACVLAARFIKKDIDLLQSADRIR